MRIDKWTGATSQSERNGVYLKLERSDANIEKMYLTFTADGKIEVMSNTEFD